jgi:hypothetical protein
MQPRCSICWTVQNLAKVFQGRLPTSTVHSERQPVRRSLHGMLGDREHIAAARSQPQAE